MNELKPCPFCGGEAFLEEEKICDEMSFWFVICMKCGGSKFSDKNLAVKAWNRRVQNG